MGGIEGRGRSGLGLGVGSVIVVAGAVAVFVATADVIAAPGTIDQSPTGSGARGLWWTWGYPLLMLALTLAGVFVVLRERWHRLDRAPARPHVCSPPLAFGVAAALLLAGGFGGAMVASTPEGGVVDHIELTRRFAGRYAGQLLIVGLYLLRVFRAEPPSPDRRAGVLGSIGVGAVTLLMLWPLLQLVSLAARWLRSLFEIDPAGVIAHETLSTMIDAPRDAWIALLAVLLVLGPPLVEEIMYRGLIQRALLEMTGHRWLAIGLTSGAFVLMHVGAVDVHALPTLFVFSLGLGWAYDRTGRLLAPMIMHGLFNLANLVLAFSL